MFRLFTLLALCLLVESAGAQPPIPTNQPPIKSAKVGRVAPRAPAGSKPAALLIARPPAAPPFKYLAVSRGPSPYEDNVNIDTFVEATPELGKNVTWTPVASGHTNTFVFDRTVTNQYWRMKFDFAGNPKP